MNGRGAVKFQKKVNNIKAESKKEDDTDHDSSDNDEEEKDELGELASEEHTMNAIKVIYLNRINHVNTKGASDLPMLDALYSKKKRSKERLPVRVLADTGASANVIAHKLARKWKLKDLKPSQKYKVQDAQNNSIEVC